MKITFFHSSILPVKKYGGTERILYSLMKELSKRGHEISFIGHPECDLESIGINHIHCHDFLKWEDLIPKSSDILHLQHNQEMNLKMPVVNTIHGNGQIGESFPKNSIFVSKQHAFNHGASTYVYNGIDFSQYPQWTHPEPKRWEHFLFLAKASWSVKNLKDCIKACKKAKKHLHIVGGKSFIPSKYIHSYGQLGGEGKLNVMKKCDALLFPVLWPEPFGMAMAEAMGMELPVIGSNYGSLPDLIKADVGKTCRNFDEFLETIKLKENPFDRKIVAKYARESFSLKKMTDNYLAMYEKVLKGEVLNLTAPSWSQKLSAQTKLSF